MAVFFIANSRDPKKAINEVNTSTIKQQAVDSAINAIRGQEKAKIDSVNAIGEKKIAGLKKNIAKLEDRLKKQEVAYSADTTAHSPGCDSLINTYSELTDSLHKEVVIDEDIIECLQRKVNVMDMQIIDATSARDRAYHNIDRLTKELNKQTNWWHRNERWVMLGAGFIGGIFLMK